MYKYYEKLEIFENTPGIFKFSVRFVTKLRFYNKQI